MLSGSPSFALMLKSRLLAAAKSKAANKSPVGNTIPPAKTTTDLLFACLEDHNFTARTAISTLEQIAQKNNIDQ